MRLSRGRSTPTRRAMWWRFPSVLLEVSVTCRVLPASGQAPASRPGVVRCVVRQLSDHVEMFGCGLFGWDARRTGSALALLVARVLADHHDAAVATDHLALVTESLDTRVDLHDAFLVWSVPVV